MHLLATFSISRYFWLSARSSRMLDQNRECAVKKKDDCNLNRVSERFTGSVDQEQEHIWRELLQKQLGEHWLNLYYPEQPQKEPILAKIRGDGGKAA